MRLFRFCQIAFLWTVLLAGSVQFATAQKGSFIYLQSDEQQPFYVTVNGKNVSSSSIGYLILSKLPDGSLPVRIGFPNSNNVQDYDLKVAGNDQGYLIKNFGDKGWGLFNLQSLDVQISGVELGKRGKETAAQKAVEEKRIADSVAVETARQEAIQQADSVKTALAAQALELQKLDSMKMVAAAQEAETRQLDSIKATAAASEKATADELATTKAARKTADSTAKATAANKKKGITDKKDPKKKDVTAKKPAAEIAAKEVAAEVMVATGVAAAETVVTEKEKAAGAKSKAEKKVPVSKITEQSTDSGKVVVYKDGADTVTAFFNKESAVQTETANDDTIVIRVPARAAKKAADTIALAAKKQQAANGQPADEVAKSMEPAAGQSGSMANKKFLDIEINHDSALVTPDTLPAETIQKVDTGTVVAEKLSTLTVVDTPKQAVEGGLTPNNSNTKIVVLAATMDSAAEARQRELPPTVDLPNDTSKGKKVVGLTSNNPNTKIVVVPTVTADEPTEKSKEEIAKTEVITAAAEKPTEAAAKIDSVMATATTAPVATNLACKDIATEKDFFNVRKSMVMGADADEMIMAGKKAFKEKCYSTAQIRNLCVLFLSDADRYSFLDAVYPYTSDANNFASLADLLKESYYVNRFKAMLK